MDTQQHETPQAANEFAFLLQTFLQKFKVPVDDIEKNAKALFSETISKMDLVTREEFERQNLLLQRSQQELASLKEKIALFESLQSQK